MNIFMILIMTVMLGMYQYFTAKRSSDVTLNKDEKAFEVELNCLKQFHEYGASRNESVLYSTKIDADYVCAGSEEIKMYKYCLAGNTEIDCGDSTVTQHCVATTSQKKGLENSLKALLFQKGIEEIKDKGYIKGIKISQNNHPVSSSQTTTYGLVTCVPAEQIKQNEKLANEDCKKQGKFATLKADGTWECTDVPDLTECTAHEISYDSKPADATNCTGPINGKYCCANTSIANNICGNDPNIKATWNTSTRFYNCTTGDEVCNNRDLTLKAVDENNSPIGSGGIIIPKPTSSTPSSEKFYTAKYNSTTRRWDCIPNGKKLISECKKFTLNNKYAYVSVSNLSTTNGTPICNGASSNSASAIETCSACGTAEIDPVTNQWKCSYATTWAQLKGKGSAYIDKLRGGSSGTNNKGVQACFQGCTDEMIASIKAGKPNGVNWGLSWNSTSLLWECFSCDKEGQIKGAYMNENCKPKTDDTKECKDDTYTDANCNQSKINGRCVLKCCNELYQKRGTDGGCYTKWCRNIPAEVNAVISRPQDKTCPTSHPRLMYNNVQDCVYCIRTPPVRI